MATLSNPPPSSAGQRALGWRFIKESASYIITAMKTLCLLTFTVFATPAPASRVLFADSQTWSGQISDSACGAKHEEAAEGQGKMPDRECTQACVKGGSKYVLVSNGKVLQIANQDNKDLATHAGHTVKLTGDLKGASITVSRIEMP